MASASVRTADSNSATALSSVVAEKSSSLGTSYAIHKSCSTGALACADLFCVAPPGLLLLHPPFRLHSPALRDYSPLGWANLFRACGAGASLDCPRFFRTLAIKVVEALSAANCQMLIA